MLHDIWKRKKRCDCNPIRLGAENDYYLRLDIDRTRKNATLSMGLAFSITLSAIETDFWVKATVKMARSHDSNKNLIS